jgi:hypothetical protein
MAVPVRAGAFATTKDRTERSGDGGNDITLPSSIVTGELLCIHIAYEGDATPSTISGWDRVLYENTNNYVNIVCYERVATGSDGTSVNVSFGDNNADFVAKAFRLENVDTDEPRVYEINNGSSNTADPPSVTYGWTGDTQTLVVVTADDMNITGDPSGYTSDVADDNGKSNYELWFKTTPPTTSPEDPSTVSVSNNRRWKAATIAIKGSGGGISNGVKVWNSSAWVTTPMKVWNGSAWVIKPLKIWNGSAFV